jgi:hypothetical protein
MRAMIGMLVPGQSAGGESIAKVVPLLFLSIKSISYMFFVPLAAD